MVLAATYVVMALGLNIIVGFAGLLHLGYVAVFAIGAYTAAYFGSGFWSGAGSDGRGISVLAGDPRPACPASTSTSCSSSRSPSPRRPSPAP